VFIGLMPITERVFKMTVFLPDLISTNPRTVSLLKSQYGERGGLILKQRQTTLWCVVLRDASSPGAWRYQCFARDGFHSHHTCGSFEQAVFEAVQSGYVVRCGDGLLDQVAQTPDWQRGMLVCDLIRQVNSGRVTFGEASRSLQEFDRRANPSRS